MDLKIAKLTLIVATALAMPPQRESSNTPTVETSAANNDIHHVPCKPREIVVPVTIATGTEIILVPDMALVKRCGGYCGTAVVCLPDKIRFVKRKVREVNLLGGAGNSIIQIRTVKVEEHETCKCGCKIQKEDCLPGQRFDAQSCKCVCVDNGALMTCTAPRIRNQETCSCDCPKNTITQCSTGSLFHQERCKCVSKKRRKKA